ncbi:MAG TPA: ectonucleotide pyrophosphatase/phosphodiesterase [Bryobacteraceae bacterium]|nr:ectonucleotide pyrophosphatase/phosphodiesterase [Bryobacteraceae bacterium]
MKSTRRFLFPIVAAALLALAARAQTEKPYVVLVSIDGFRFDYPQRYKTKNLLAIGEAGVGAEMIPSFPSVTFPNHISIATGMYPEHHGMVGNSFFDPAKNASYDMRNSAKLGSWYERGTPLWVLAERQHMLAACMFWPTCDGEIGGVRPTYWKLYDGSFADEKRVEQVIQWLKLPPEKRPHFITLYFSDVDSSGHRNGPESLETAQAAELVDSMIGKLRKGIDELHLRVDLIVVSDHGMQDVTEGEVDVGRYADASVRVVAGGPVAYFYCKDAEAIEKTYEKLSKNSKLEVYRRAETPASWHFNENPREGDLVAIVKGAAIFTTQELGPRGGAAHAAEGRAWIRSAEVSHHAFDFLRGGAEHKAGQDRAVRERECVSVHRQDLGPGGDG